MSNNITYDLNHSELKEMFIKFENELKEKGINRDNIDINVIKDFIEQVSLKINRANTKSDVRFIPYGRMTFLREEFTRNINEKRYLDALFDIEDYLDESRIQPNYESHDPSIVDNNKEYFSENVICSEEKEILMDMIKELIVELENSTTQSSIPVPDSLKEFICFDENGYVFAKQKLPRELEDDYNIFIENYYESDDNELINNIVNRINEIPYNTEITIAQLIDYKPETGFVTPLTQGIIKNAVLKKCETKGIKLEENNDEIGGLAYFVKFKKIN